MSTYEARHQILRAVSGMTAGLGDPRNAVHDPLAALTALSHLRAALAREELEAASRAREDGRSWDVIGEAMGYPLPGITSAAERAFTALAADLGTGPAVPWTCPSCRRVVIDYGPEAGVLEREQGYGDGCERFAAEIAAWEQEAGQ